MRPSPASKLLLATLVVLAVIVVAILAGDAITQIIKEVTS